MQRSVLSLTSHLSLLTLLSLTLSAAVGGASDRCQTLMTDMLITKEKPYEYNGRRMTLTCVGEVLVAKCEGTCVSQVSPSIANYPGFKKDCKCCREKNVSEREVMLDKCYDGTSLIPGQYKLLSLREPDGCHCHRCLS